MDIQRQAQIIEKHCGINYQKALDVAAKCNGKKDWKTYKDAVANLPPNAIKVNPHYRIPYSDCKYSGNLEHNGKGFYVAVKTKAEVRYDIMVDADTPEEAEGLIDLYLRDAQSLLDFQDLHQHVTYCNSEVIYIESRPFITKVIDNKKDPKIYKDLTSSEIEALHSRG